MSPADPSRHASGARDRDRLGRPRTNRPRDGLGRPLPRGAAGVQGQPERQAERQPRTPEQTIRAAQRLLDDGMPFHAHEVFEDAWKAAPPEERELWRGLAQLAVGLTHARRGNPRGAYALLCRGADNLLAYTATRPHGLDISGVVGWSHAAAQAIDADEPIPAMPPLRSSSPSG